MFIVRECVAGEKVEVFFSRQKTTKCALGGGDVDISCDFFERVHMYACTHGNSADVRGVFFSDGALCFFLIFFVILMACGVSVCACTHVRMCSPIILLSLPHK